MQDYKIYAALAYARENRLNRTTIDSPERAARHHRLGQVLPATCSKRWRSWASTEETARRSACACSRSPCPGRWSRTACASSRDGLDEILVVEEKRQMVEYQLKEQLYNWRERRAPARDRQVRRARASGSHPRGEWLLPAKADFSVAQIARVIAARIARFHTSDLIKARLTFLEAKEAVLEKAVNTPPRPAYYCSGCPAQHVDQGARRQPRAGRHRLPRDGDVDLPGAHADHDAHGRRGRAVDRPGAVLEAAARVRQSGRRHLLPLGLARDPRGRRGQRQHHLQDPVQRRRRDDRRPADRWIHLGAA